VLLDIAGKPMLQWVYQQACASNAKSVTIATDSEEVAQAAQQWGASVCLTLASHPSGTDRLAEVIAKQAYASDEIVVNVQGDEPFIPPAIINQVATLLATHPQAQMATLCESITAAADIFNPNIVKVVMNAVGEALYFSRAPIPWDRAQFNLSDIDANRLISLDKLSFYRHIGLYAYRPEFVTQFVTWPAAPLEQLEQLEQLRALYYGHNIMVELASAKSPVGVDTAEDLEVARQWGLAHKQ
jgi:3-deoxy-manno-octulosonate cytidylyltransferase (CMP-KDO synthetase)